MGKLVYIKVKDREGFIESVGVANNKVLLAKNINYAKIYKSSEGVNRDISNISNILFSPVKVLKTVDEHDESRIKMNADRKRIMKLIDRVSEKTGYKFSNWQSNTSDIYTIYEDNSIYLSLEKEYIKIVYYDNSNCLILTGYREGKDIGHKFDVRSKTILKDLSDTIKKEFLYAHILDGKDEIRYDLLGRMQSDCEYYLGYGCRSKKRLWAHDEANQIEYMKVLWKSFPKGMKPKWLTWNQILAYEKAMVENK